jgi:hypothetical protein
MVNSAVFWLDAYNTKNIIKHYRTDCLEIKQRTYNIFKSPLTEQKKHWYINLHSSIKSSIVVKSRLAFIKSSKALKTVYEGRVYGRVTYAVGVPTGKAAFKLGGGLLLSLFLNKILYRSTQFKFYGAWGFPNTTSMIPSSLSVDINMRNSVCIKIALEDDEDYTNTLFCYTLNLLLSFNRIKILRGWNLFALNNFNLILFSTSICILQDLQYTYKFSSCYEPSLAHYFSSQTSGFYGVRLQNKKLSLYY